MAESATEPHFTPLEVFHVLQPEIKVDFFGMFEPLDLHDHFESVKYFWPRFHEARLCSSKCSNGQKLLHLCCGCLQLLQCCGVYVGGRCHILLLLLYYNGQIGALRDIQIFLYSLYNPTLIFLCIFLCLCVESSLFLVVLYTYIMWVVRKADAPSYSISCMAAIKRVLFDLI